MEPASVSVLSYRDLEEGIRGKTQPGLHFLRGIPVKKLFALMMVAALAAVGCEDKKTSPPAKPSTSAPAPVPSTPKPEASTPKPEVSTPKPEASTPKPAPSTPKPDVSTPKKGDKDKPDGPSVEPPKK
jgi:hypothetical protein